MIYNRIPIAIIYQRAQHKTAKKSANAVIMLSSFIEKEKILIHFTNFSSFWVENEFQPNESANSIISHQSKMAGKLNEHTVHQ